MITAKHIGKVTVPVFADVHETLPKKSPLTSICMRKKEELARKNKENLPIGKPLGDARDVVALMRNRKAQAPRAARRWS